MAGGCYFPRNSEAVQRGRKVPGTPEIGGLGESSLQKKEAGSVHERELAQAMRLQEAGPGVG